MTTASFERLFTPLRIRDVEIPNRFAAAGLGWSWTGLGASPTVPGPGLARFWGMRAAGGLGLIISEPQSVHPTSTASPQVVENTSDAVIEPYRAITQAVHEHGTKIVAHLNHIGHLGNGGYRSTPLWAPSEVRAPMGTSFPAGGGVLPHAMTADEVAEVIEGFAAAAARDIDAGFDGIEINAAEGYLLAEFLSPVTNRRSDQYGGSAEGRQRFLMEVIAAVRDRIGPGPLLGVRIGTDDHLEGGLGVDDVREIAGVVSRAGAVDYLSTTPGFVPHMGSEPGAFSELAAAAKGASGLPVLYMGWTDGPETAERLLEAAVCDLVGVSRATLADPELPRRAQAGELDRIRPCIACNQSCTTMGTTCIVNPMSAAIVMMPAAAAGGAAADASDRKKLLVIGGGPAGMQAASLLAERGHSVTLWEREQSVGGQLRVAAQAPHRERIGAFADYLERELERTGVAVETGRRATADDVRAFGADAVVIATGGFAHVPRVPGVDQPHVTDVRAILSGDAELGERVLIVLARAEHRYQGLTAAEFVAAQEKQVRVVTNAHFAGDLWDERGRLDTYQRLARFGVEFTPLVELVAIREHEAEMRNVYSLEPVTFEVDTIVLAYGDDADSALLAELERDGPPLLCAGDVVAPRDINGAIRDAYLLGMQT